MSDGNSSCDSSAKQNHQYSSICQRRVSRKVSKDSVDRNRSCLVGTIIGGSEMHYCITGGIWFCYRCFQRYTDNRLNLNEVNYVSVAALHVNALFIARYKCLFTPGFLCRGKIQHLKKICVNEFLQQNDRPKHMARSTETLFEIRFCQQFLVFSIEF